jgi:SOS-response transcriptional repressor LexA
MVDQRQITVYIYSNPYEHPAMTEKKLTIRQKEILNFISQFIEKHKFPPTRSELSAHFGFRSPNAAEAHLRALEKKSMIGIERGAARGISLLPLRRCRWSAASLPAARCWRRKTSKMNTASTLHCSPKNPTTCCG